MSKLESLETGNGINLSKPKLKDEDKWSKMDTVTSNESTTEDSVVAQLGSTASWIVNWFLLGAKTFVVITTGSKAVTAALADSAVDLVSQGILWMADRYMAKHNPDYPVGRSRLEALSVLGCASVMIMASIEVIQFSCQDLYDGLHGDKPHLFLDDSFYIIMSIGIGLKFMLWIFCRWAAKVLGSDSMDALAEDHLNDVISNLGAIATAIIAFRTVAWWVDPAGAIIISLVIIWRWIDIMNDQVKKIVGHTAPPEFIEQVGNIAKEHDTRLAVDCTRAYHFGARYNVEMEIVLPANMTVQESHDIALALQHKIENLTDVERAFVHVDHTERDGLEHKVERRLVTGDANISSKLPQVSPTMSNPMQSAVNGPVSI